MILNHCCGPYIEYEFKGFVSNLDAKYIEDEIKEGEK